MSIKTVTIIVRGERGQTKVIYGADGTPLKGDHDALSELLHEADFRPGAAPLPKVPSDKKPGDDRKPGTDEKPA